MGVRARPRGPSTQRRCLIPTQLHYPGTHRIFSGPRHKLRPGSYINRSTRRDAARHRARLRKRAPIPDAPLGAAQTPTHPPRPRHAMAERPLHAGRLQRRRHPAQHRAEPAADRSPLEPEPEPEREDRSRWPQRHEWCD